MPDEFVERVGRTGVIDQVHRRFQVLPVYAAHGDNLGHVDDGQVQAGLDRPVEKGGIQHLPGTGVQAEGDVRQAQQGRCAELAFDEPERADECRDLQRVLVVVRQLERVQKRKIDEVRRKLVGDLLFEQRRHQVEFEVLLVREPSEFFERYRRPVEVVYGVGEPEYALFPVQLITGVRSGQGR